MSNKTNSPAPTEEGPKEERPKNGSAERQGYIDEMTASLSESPRRLPSHYFYDTAGSHLFDKICELPEYYPTRTETKILENHAQEIAAKIGPRAEVIEYGSGSSTKTTLLLAALTDPARYVPIDVSSNHLNASAKRIAKDFPGLAVDPLCANFNDEIPIERQGKNLGQRVGYFPGSTLGNLGEPQAKGLLNRMAHTLGKGGLLLIGVDLVKPESVLVPAYDDSQGITASFNLNILTHLQKLIDLKVQVDGFEHLALWNPSASRMEIYLVSQKDQVLELAGQEFPVAQGERILTEYSHKYTPKSLLRIAEDFEPIAHWSDDQGWFLVQLLRVRD